MTTSNPFPHDDPTQQLITGRQRTRHSAIPVARSDTPGSDRADDDRPTTINLRLLIVTTLLAVTAVVGVQFLHHYQMQRMSHRYYELYENAWQDGQLRTAVGYLQRYTELAPHDVDAQLELVSARADAALASNSRGLLFRAFVDAEETLRESPELNDLRSKVVDLSLRMGRIHDAIFHLRQLNSRDPDDPDRQLLLARCYETDSRMLEAAAAYRRVIELDPRRFDVFRRLADILYNRLDDRAGAEKLLNDLVGANRRSPEAFLVRARFRLANGRIDAALSDVQRAWQLAPSSRDVLVLAAQIVAARAGSPDETTGIIDLVELRQKIATALKEHPDDAELLEAAARVDFVAGRIDRARQWLEQAREYHPDRVGLIWMLADINILENDLPAARELLKQLEDMNASFELQTYLQARIAMNAGEWLRARTLLESIAVSSVEQPMVRSQIELARAQCYAELGQPLHQEQSYRRSRDHFVGTVEHAIGLADSLRTQGRLDEAIAELRRVSSHPLARLELARLLFQKNLQLNPALRKWEDVESLLDSATEQVDSIAVLLLRASILVARDQHEAARDLIEKERARRDDDVRLWIGLSQIEQSAGNLDDALAILETARERLGQSPELTRALIQYWSQQPPDDHDPLQDIASDVFAVTDADTRHELLTLLADANRARGDLEQADRLLHRALEVKPHDPATWEALFDIAILRDRRDDITTCLDQIRRIDGPQGVRTRLCTARLYMYQALDGDTAQLATAQDLLREVADDLPGAPRIRVLLAEVEEHLGRPDAAIDHYRAAIDMGVTDPGVVRRLVELLYARGRVVDAEVVVERMLNGPHPPEGEIGRVAAIVSLHAARTARAVELARQSVPENSTNYADYLWLGQVYWAAGQLEDAETALRRALELGPTHTQPWLGLASFLARTGRTDEAADLTTQLDTHLAPTDATAVTAQCLEMAGRIDDARTHYMKLLELQPDDAASCWLVASFLLRHDDIDEAEKLLQQAIDIGEPLNVVIAARRARAVLLSARGSATANERALELIDANLEKRRSPDDLRVKTHLLALRPTLRRQREIISILTALDREQSLTDEDTVRLARAWIATGQRKRAEELMRVTIARRRTSPDLLAGCLDIAFTHMPDSGDIQSWMETLTALEPDSFRTRELRIRYFAYRDEASKALEQIRYILDNITPEEQIETSLRLADALALLIHGLEDHGHSITADRLSEEAEQLYRSVAEVHPEHLLTLARYLSFRWQPADALAVCREAQQTCRPEDVAATYVEIILMHGVASNTAESIHQWFLEQLDAQPDSALLHLHYAGFAQLIREYDLAIQHYRRTIDLAPESVAAWNELAVLLLLHQGTPDEALQAIRTAIELQGAHPTLLDTQAMVLIALQQYDEAAQLLEEAIADQPSPVYYFHLAQALLPSSRTSARKALQDGIQLGLRTNVLHPLERPAYQQLVSDLDG